MGSVEGWVVLDAGGYFEGEGAVLRVNLGRPIVTSGDFATRLLPNYFGQDLFSCMFGCYTRLVISALML